MNKTIDLRGSFCPYPVVETIDLFDSCADGEEIIALVDDPLAVKAIPEELAEDNVEYIKVTRLKRYWEIKIIK